MTTISIIPGLPDTGYVAVSEGKHSEGKTVGQALDALTSQLSPEQRGTLVVVQTMAPDRFFTKEQQDRLGELMAKWRAARDSGGNMEPSEDEELAALIQTEVEAATYRAAAMLPHPR